MHACQTLLSTSGLGPPLDHVYFCNFDDVASKLDPPHPRDKPAEAIPSTIMAETAPDATVNTLRELLTGHASYLGQLYASLGASDDVVPSKMQELHQALVLCIENQRKQAEEEIAAVHRELESLHGELKALAASLGCKLTPDQPDEVRSLHQCNLVSYLLPLESDNKAIHASTNRHWSPSSPTDAEHEPTCRPCETNDKRKSTGWSKNCPACCLC